MAAARPQRGRPGRHVPGPLRAQRLRRGPVKRLTDLDLGDAALVFGRIDRYAESPDDHRELPHRAPRRRRRALRARRGRLAGAGRRAVLPGHRPRADGPRSPAPLRRRGPHRARHRGRAVRRGPPRRRPRRGPGDAATATATAGRRSAATRRCSPPSSAAAPARSATSSPRSRPSRTRSSARRRPACWSSRAARARARPSSPCTAPPTCCTPTASRSRTRACSSSGPTASSCATSSGCCRRSARPASSRSCSPTSCPTSSWPARATRATPRWPPASRATPACPTSSTRPSATASGRCATTSSCRSAPATSASPSRSRPRIVKAARRRFRRHNAGRRFVEGEVFAAMAASWRGERRVAPANCARRSATCPRCGTALERMWPVLTPAQLLHDLFGSTALLRLAAGGVLDDAEIDALYRPRSADVATSAGRPTDVALLDDAREVLGPRPGRGGRVAESDEIRTYGHIVVDEVQDLTPMQLRMATRRSLNGSLTVVGDLAQATGALAPTGWDDVLAHLPDAKPARVVGLSVGYRIPAQIMELADRVMAAATPELRSPARVRIGDAAPDDRAGRRRPGVVRGRGDGEDGRRAAGGERRRRRPRRPRRRDLRRARRRAASSTAGRRAPGSTTRVTVVPVSVVKGLELDGVVVVEPARIVSDEAQGAAGALRRPDPADAAAHGRPRRRPATGPPRDPGARWVSAAAQRRPRARRCAEQLGCDTDPDVGGSEGVEERAQGAGTGRRVLEHPPVAEPFEHGHLGAEPLG